ncbi:MAG: CRISPR system precrRNA processing endoribonuclease RAMP protein Cas6 [Dethiobacter sp.]|jgi:hypothetical protein|nr:MAG: CRISPR system precrRNA processing endoribonuclease RAMP protein Cas6 [Dethiobacter sp.]
MAGKLSSTYIELKEGELLFKEFRLACYRFTLCPQNEGIVLPFFKGTIFLQEKFKNILYRLSCKLKQRKCPDCFFNLHCPYALLYEKINFRGWSSCRSRYLPAPFVWQPPLEKKTDYIAEEKIIFNLILLGRGISFLEVFIRAFQEFAAEGSQKQGKLILKNVLAVNPFTGKSRLIFESEHNHITKTELVTSGEEIELWAERMPEVSRLSLLFVTPTGLKEQDGYLEEPYFYHIIKALVTRASIMYYFHHHNRELEIHYRNFLDKAEQVRKVRDYTRFVSWEKSSRGSSWGRGFLGEVEYTGKLHAFLPLLKLGEFMHLGENAAFGLGRYRIKRS